MNISSFYRMIIDMIRIFYRDMTDYRAEKPNGDLCKVKAYSGHCKQYDAIYVDDSLNQTEQRLAIIHEALELSLPRTKHSKLDIAAIKITEALQAGKFLK